MKTSMHLSGGRVEIRTRARLRCPDCGTDYHPRVHAHPGLVVGIGLGAVLVVVAAAAMWAAGWVERWWLLWAKVVAAVSVALIGIMASRLQRRLMTPSFHSPDSGREPAFGEIVLGCPRCGSTALPRAPAPEVGPRRSRSDRPA